MYEKERQELILTLREKGITNERVLKAFLEVERHLFIPQALHGHAYVDNALPIGFDQTISQPYTVAFMTQVMNPQPGNKILEIGTGSGYQAVILNYLGAKVYSIERNHNLYLRTSQLFDNLGYRIALRCSDGTLGWDEFAPYDGIIVTAGGPEIPTNLKKQLAPGGILIIPVGDRKSQKMHILQKTGVDSFKTTIVPDFSFVPLIGREGWKIG